MVASGGPPADPPSRSASTAASPGAGRMPPSRRASSARPRTASRATVLQSAGGTTTPGSACGMMGGMVCVLLINLPGRRRALVDPETAEMMIAFGHAKRLEEPDAAAQAAVRAQLR